MRKPLSKPRPPTRAEFAMALSAWEGQFLEFKEALSDSLARELTAFANAEGGRIYLGVADDKSVKGCQITNKLLSRIQDMARHCDPAIEIGLAPFDYQGRTILMVEVLEGARKPYGCSEGYFLRTGPNSQKMSQDELLRFVRNQGPSFFDETPCRDFKYPSNFSVQAFKNFLRASKITAGSISREDLLVNLGIAKRGRRNLVFTNAGVLFFAKRPQLFHLQSRVTCILFQGTARTTILDRKDFSGVLADNVEAAMTFLHQHLPLRYEITSLKRKEILAVPEAALREALLNAVIHRDYFSSGVVMVEIHRDKVEIVNPGGLVPGLSLETLGGRSLPRNPLIAELFLRSDEVEKAGTGIGRIREAVSAAGLEPPSFKTDSFFSVSFPLPETPGNVPARLGPAEGTQSGPSRDQVTEQVAGQVAGQVTEQVRAILSAARKPCSSKELQEVIGLRSRPHFQTSYLEPILKAGWLEMTIPGKPNSRLQRYRTTAAGKAKLGRR
ncbi:MAG: putative DNA binding domain-containing protein [Elusimicrobia bacterium]|nr:putative DNA binding domain-containing protein [Elusimicrobiota bacterium]